jgi:hypothetical protein
MGEAAPSQLEAAVVYERGIAEEARVIRGNSTALTPELFLKLWPLLERSIPEGFIKTVGVVTGKPYESTGISSVQVQVDRMNNVLTPLWWHDHTEYSDEGRVAHVEVHVRDGAGDGEPLIVREAWGGVNRGSTTGNVYKGSYTNAAKLAFARLGPGHEIYLGATDLDPDVDEKAAAEQVKPQRSQRAEGPRALTDAERAKVVKAIEDAGNDEDGLMMILGAVGAESTDDLTTAQAFEIRKLLDEGTS